MKTWKVLFTACLLSIVSLQAETIHTILSPSITCSQQTEANIEAIWENGVLEIMKNQEVRRYEYSHCEHMMEHSQKCFYGNNKEVMLWQKGFPSHDLCIEADYLKDNVSGCTYAIGTPFPCK